MEVIAKLKKGGRDLVNLLEKEEMIRARLTKTGIVVPLSANKEGVYRIPLSIRDKKPYIFLSLEESGGSNGDAGFGQIICGSKGERLRPFYIKDSLGRFIVANKAAIICAWSINRDIVNLTIETHSIQRNNSNVVIKNNQVWKGKNSKLPEHLSQFERAAEAAVRKSKCPGCKHLHFVT
jgi:hypothetical protein